MKLLQKTLLTVLPCMVLNVGALATDELAVNNQPLPLNYDENDDYFKQFESANYQHVIPNPPTVTQNVADINQTDVFPEIKPTINVQNNVQPTAVESNTFPIVEPTLQANATPTVEPISDNLPTKKQTKVEQKETIVADNFPVGFEHRKAIMDLPEGFEHRVAVAQTVAKPTVEKPQKVEKTEKVVAKVEQKIATLTETQAVQAVEKVVKSANSNHADALIARAKKMLGVPYRFGGTSPSTGFDCSGFMQYVFNDTVKLPRISSDMATVGRKVSRSDLKAGDMVFFAHSGSRITHVGMYIGEGRFIHSPSTGKTVEITAMDSKYWSSRFITARRVI